MFERLCALLFCFYPIEFRRTYGREAWQLICDRASVERSVPQRLRLLSDLTIDVLATSLRGWKPAAPTLVRVDGGPRFDIIEVHGPRPQAIVAGVLTSTLMFASFTFLFEPTQFPDVPLQVGEGSGAGPEGFPSDDQGPFVIANNDDARHRLIDSVSTMLRQFYVDRAIGQQLADALLAYEKKGDYNMIATGPELVQRLTNDIYQTSHAIGVPRGVFVADVVYSERPIPIGPPPPMTEEMIARNRANLLQQHCYIRDNEIMPNNIGYLRVIGFPDGASCAKTIADAMATINDAEAVIIDLRGNGGGFGDSARQIASYFFDRPTFLYDPRAKTPVPSHTASPVAGNKLVDKPLYVLTSSLTQSAAEYFVYNMKVLKRATIVGEKTAGHQHSGAFHRINDHFGIGIQEDPVPDNPFPVKGWEIIGIDPDVSVPRAEALDAAKKLAASRAKR